MQKAKHKIYTVSAFLTALAIFAAFCLTGAAATLAPSSSAAPAATTTKAPATQPATAALSDGHWEQLLVDDAGLLRDSQVRALREGLADISQRQSADVAVVTVESLGGKTAEAYADDYFDYNGYGQGADRDGIMLLISMGEREWHITTTGFAISAFTDSDLDYMEGEFIGYLSDGDYSRAFITFADLCNEGLTQYHARGEDWEYSPEEPVYPNGSYSAPAYPWDSTLYHSTPTPVIPIALGLILALIVVLMMRSRHKNVRHNPTAMACVVPGSVNIRSGGELFLGRHVSRHARPQDNDYSSGGGGHSFGGGGSSTHSSSSGSSHGGSGG
ncbi:MAG: TPM domain-containing protein, partial [Oscillospiraceae bacterium]|nr:TPM domain-containing protein [Oscillospiraceae bacterium]